MSAWRPRRRIKLAVSCAAVLLAVVFVILARPWPLGYRYSGDGTLEDSGWLHTGGSRYRLHLPEIDLSQEGVTHRVWQVGVLPRTQISLHIWFTLAKDIADVEFFKNLEVDIEIRDAITDEVIHRHIGTFCIPKVFHSPCDVTEIYHGGAREMWGDVARYDVFALYLINGYENRRPNGCLRYRRHPLIVDVRTTQHRSYGGRQADLQLSFTGGGWDTIATWCDVFIPP